MSCWGTERDIKLLTEADLEEAERVRCELLLVSVPVHQLVIAPRLGRTSSRRTWVSAGGDCSFLGGEGARRCC